MVAIRITARPRPLVDPHVHCRTEMAAGEPIPFQPPLSPSLWLRLLKQEDEGSSMEDLPPIRCPDLRFGPDRAARSCRYAGVPVSSLPGDLPCPSRPYRRAVPSPGRRL